MEKLFRRLNEQLEVLKIRKQTITESEKVELTKEVIFNNNFKNLQESVIKSDKK